MSQILNKYKSKASALWLIDLFQICMKHNHSSIIKEKYPAGKHWQLERHVIVKACGSLPAGDVPAEKSCSPWTEATGSGTLAWHELGVEEVARSLWRWNVLQHAVKSDNRRGRRGNPVREELGLNYRTFLKHILPPLQGFDWFSAQKLELCSFLLLLNNIQVQTEAKHLAWDFLNVGRQATPYKPFSSALI